MLSCVVVFVGNDVVLISPRAKGISGPEKFWSSPQKDFFNTIRSKADVRGTPTYPPSASQRPFWHARKPDRFHELSIFGSGDPLGRIHYHIAAADLWRCA